MYVSVEHFLSFVYISLKEIDLLLVSAFFPRTDSCLDSRLRSQHYTESSDTVSSKENESNLL